MKNMRRKDREISEQVARELLMAAEYGILATVDQKGQPYGVPLSFVYKGDAIYFHSATTGHKLENIAANPRVSFSIVGKTKVLPEQFSTEYESAIAFGTAGEVHGEGRTQALVWLLEKYSPEQIEEGRKYIEKLDNSTTVIKVVVSHVSGKARR